MQRLTSNYQAYINSTQITGNMYGLLTKCEVKMAGYWPSSFFCVFIDLDKHKLAKKEWHQYSTILTEQTWSIKDFYIAFGEIFLVGYSG